MTGPEPFGNNNPGRITSARMEITEGRWSDLTPPLTLQRHDAETPLISPSRPVLRG